MVSSAVCITNVRILADVRGISNGWLCFGNGKISAFGAGTPPVDVTSAAGFEMIDGHGMTLMPGMIDLHVHGAMGYEVMDADPDGLRAMARFYATHGVTGFLATTWTATREAIHAALDCVSQVMRTGTHGTALLGAHLEGPYLNPARCGAQDPELIRKADLEEAAGFFSTGVVKLIALAPEFPENIALVQECARRGIRVSAGHTDATYEQMQAAVRAGVRQVTHCYNAMSPLNHRNPGVVGAAMALPEIQCELIADNIHVHPGAMRSLALAKGVENILLITDAIRGTGLPDGDHPIDHRIIHIRDGEARLDNGALAGSVLTLEQGLHNFCEAAGLSVEQAWVASSANAAAAVGLGDVTGRISAGYQADLVLLDDHNQVHGTWVGGTRVYTKE